MFDLEGKKALLTVNTAPNVIKNLVQDIGRRALKAAAEFYMFCGKVDAVFLSHFLKRAACVLGKSVVDHLPINHDSALINSLGERWGDVSLERQVNEWLIVDVKHKIRRLQALL